MSTPFCLSIELDEDTDDPDRLEGDHAGPAKCGIALITPCMSPTVNFFLVGGILEDGCAGIFGGSNGLLNT